MPCVISRGRLRGGEAAGFVRPASLLGCSEKSPRQLPRAGLHQIDHRANLKVIGADDRICPPRAGARIR
jgi:hypothetical protein